MCRHLARLGPRPVTLASLITEPEHSLLVQSYAPADMRGGGTVNADGFGVGFAPGRRSAAQLDPDAGSAARGHGDAHRPPVVYRNPVPMWTDASFLDLATAIESTVVVAAVRSATVGMPVAVGACAPFCDRDAGLLFSHNGVVRGWPTSMATLAATLPALDLLTLEAATDSALLWALLRARLAAGADLAAATAGLVVDVLAAAPGSRLNLIVTDGERVVATAVDHALSVRTDDDGTVVVASEPLTADDAWRPVRDGSLVVARPGCGAPARPPTVEVTALPL